MYAAVSMGKSHDHVHALRRHPRTQHQSHHHETHLDQSWIGTQNVHRRTKPSVAYCWDQVYPLNFPALSHHRIHFCHQQYNQQKLNWPLLSLSQNF